MITKEALHEGQMLMIEGKFKEAVHAFTNAIKAGEDPFITHLSRGVAYLRIKDFDHAISDFDEAIKIKGDNFRPYYYRGMAEMLKEDYDRSIKDFSKALDLNPELHSARFARAVCYGRTGQDDRAIEDFKVVIPEMERDLEAFADVYGFVKTDMWRVMEELTGEAPTPSTSLTQEDLETIKKWAKE